LGHLHINRVICKLIKGWVGERVRRSLTLPPCIFTSRDRDVTSGGRSRQTPMLTTVAQVAVYSQINTNHKYNVGRAYIVEC